MESKRLAIVLLISVLTLLVKANTCDSLTLTSQNDVDGFHLLNCDSISGTLLIEGLGISNLDSLIGLMYIEGDLIINNTSVQSFSGLDSLKFMGGNLRIQSCFELSSLVNLSHLNIVSQVLIENCTSLDSIVINSMTQITSANIMSNGNVIYLSIANYTQPSPTKPSFFVENNPRLNSIIAFTSANGLGNLSIVNNPLLMTIEPFSGVVMVNSISIVENDNLTEISCLPNLRYQLGGQTNIQSNILLSKIDFSKVKQFEDLFVHYNPVLNDCCFLLNGVVVVHWGPYISDNGPGCSELAQVISFCEMNDPDGDQIVNEQDNCPGMNNPTQSDFDSDGVGNDCDNCPGTFNPDQLDSNQNGIGDLCESSYSYKIGLHTTEPKAGVQVDSSDLYIGDLNRGLILRNFLGDCFRVSIDEWGQIKTTLIPCPN